MTDTTKWIRLPGVRPYSYSAAVPFGGLTVGLHVTESGERQWRSWIEISGWEVWVGVARSAKEAQVMAARKLQALAGDTRSAARRLES